MLIKITSCCLCKISFCILFFLTSQIAHAQDQVFKDFFKAVGGRSALENLKTIQRVGEIEFANHGQTSPRGKGTYRTDLIYPDKVRVQISVGDYVYDEMKNEKVYYFLQNGEFQDVQDSNQRKQLDETGLKANRELLYWQKEHAEIEALKINPTWAVGTSCVKGKKNDKTDLVCFDKKTHLLSAAGSSEEYRLYKDWKKSDELKFPMHIIHVKKDLVVYEIKLTSLMINRMILAASFEKPQPKKQ